MEKENADAATIDEFCTGTLSKAVVEGDVDYGSVMSGQIAGLVNKEQPAAEIIEEMFKEAAEINENRIVFAGREHSTREWGRISMTIFASAREVFDDVGEEVREWCFYGTKEMLRQTHITQPCIYAVTMAAYSAFMEAMKREGLSDKVEFVKCPVSAWVNTLH